MTSLHFPQVRSPGPGRSGLFGAVVLALAAAVALPVLAQGPAAGPPMGRSGGGPGMMALGDPMQVSRMLDDVKATDAQRTQIRQIMRTAMADMKAQRAAAQAMHEQGLQLLAAPTIDAAAAEALRQQMATAHDAASKRMLQTMLDVANVLTPEQRATLVEHIRQRDATMLQHMQHRERGMQSTEPKN